MNNTQTSLLIQRQKSLFVWLFVLFLLLVCLLGIHLLTGYKGVELVWPDANILQNIRLPRALGALFVGALLGLSGAIMQGVLKNPLASPFTLGVSQAAAFGASFAIIVLQAYTMQSPLGSTLLVTISAFVASLLAISLIIMLSKISSLDASSMILAGVGLGSLFQAMTMFVQYFADDMEVAATLFWTFGDLSKANFQNITLMALFLFPILGLFLAWHWKLDALGFGDESALSRGINVRLFRLVSLLLASLLSAVTVSFFGIIGFIGLVAPHIVKMLIAKESLSVIIFSSIVGANLVLLADLVAKTVMLPTILPIGILSSFMGVPIFLYLLLQKKAR